MLITAAFGTDNTGLAVYYRILNADKTTYAARTTTGVTELVASSGTYGVEVDDTDLIGRTVVWDIDGTSKTASETFPTEVSASLIGTPAVVDGGTATIAGMLLKMLDDNAGNDFDATFNSLHEVYVKLEHTLYQSGIWIDTIDGSAGSTVGENGTPWNPVNNYADAYILATDLGVKKYFLSPDSSITLTHAHNYWQFEGKGVVNLNGQSIIDSDFVDLEEIYGTSAGDDAKFVNCTILTATLGAALFQNCRLAGTLTLVNGDDYTFQGCVDGLPGGLEAPTIIFAGNNAIGLRNWRGGVQLNNMSATDAAKIDGVGRVVIHDDCAGGDLVVRGNFTITDEVVGGFTGDITETARIAMDQFDDMNEMLLFLKDCQNGELVLEDDTPIVGKVTLKLYSTDATPVLLSTRVVTKATGYRAEAI